MPSPRGTFVHRLIRWRLLLVVNLFVMIFLGLSLSREMVRSRIINAEIAELQTRSDELTTRNIDLSELKTAMQTESYIEREARLKLGMKKPGETVAVIQEANQGTALDDTAEQGSMTDPLGLVIDGKQTGNVVANPSKWWYYFFDKNAFNALIEYE